RQPGLDHLPLAMPPSDSWQQSWEEQGIVYRGLAEWEDFGPSLPWPGAPERVLIRVVLDTSYHQHFIDDIKRGLAWFTGGIALISVLLGWLASRLGLKPLRELASVSTRVSAAKLDHRLS